MGRSRRCVVGSVRSQPPVAAILVQSPFRCKCVTGFLFNIRLPATAGRLAVRVTDAMVVGSTREGRKKPHSAWRWTRLEPGAAGNAAHMVLVRVLGALEKETKSIKISSVGIDTIDFELGTAITYDGVYKKVERILSKHSAPKTKPFSNWLVCAYDAASASNVASAAADPQQSEQPPTQDEASAETAMAMVPAASPVPVAATAASFPFPLELISPKTFAAVEDMRHTDYANFGKEYTVGRKRVYWSGDVRQCASCETS